MWRRAHTDPDLYVVTSSARLRKRKLSLQDERTLGLVVMQLAQQRGIKPGKADMSGGVR